MNERGDTDEHAWVRERLVARLAGLLEDEAENRFDSHLAGCAACADVWSRYVAAQDDDETESAPDGHLPPDLIAAWPAASRSLTGLERELVAHHLDRCADCRTDLEFLGHDPVLKIEAAAEATPADNVVSLPTPPAGGDRNWRTWLGWGWGAAATAAALTLWLIPAETQRPPGGGIVPWVASSSVRGDGADSAMTIAPGTTRVLVAVRVPALLSIEEALILRILGPDDEPLQESRVEPSQLAGRMLMIDLVGSEPLAAGAYRVVFLDSNGGPLSDGTVERTFSLEIAPD